jgi:hypothetical protein
MKVEKSPLRKQPQHANDEDYSIMPLKFAEQLGNPLRRLSVSNTSVSGMLPQMQNSQFILLNSAKASAIQ